MKGLLTFMLLAAALAAGATQTAHAADGWFNGANVDLIFANANGELRVRTNPKPQNAAGANFGCTEATLRLGLSNADGNDDVGLSGLWDIMNTAYMTGASVDMYLDEVSSGTRVECYVNRAQLNPIARTPTTPTTPTPTTPTPPDPPRGYYGALALNAEDGPGPLWVWAHETNASTQAVADRLALSLCRAKLFATGDTCSIKQRFSAGRCVVLYVDNQTNRTAVSGTDVRANLAALDSRAKARCEERGRPCRRVVSACNSGTASIAPQTLTPLVSEKR